MKTRGQLPHLFYPEPTMQRRQINSYAFPMGFDPLSLSPILWLDASDSATLYSLSSGGSLPADDGGVRRIEDKSASANHAIQTIAGDAWPPLRNVSAVNGLDALAFADLRHLSLTSSTVAATSFVSFAVYTRASSGIASPIFSNDGESYTAFWFSDNNIYFRPSGEDFLSPAGGTGTGTFLITSVRVGGNLTIRRNGSVLNTASMSASASSVFTTVGRRGGSVLNGNFCELIHCNGTLGTTDIDDCEAALMTKWGI